MTITLEIADAPEEIQLDIPPSKMLLDAPLYGILDDTQAEEVLRNILILTKRKNRWFRFLSSDYAVLVDHRVTNTETWALERLVTMGYLLKHSYHYRVEEKTCELLLKTGRVAHLDWSPTRTCFGRHK